mmetsp:Transcript_50599/g.156589  ORF Transcript_50599/g.156589 Transcript_50599/m.156589 type:complete len:288 (+) Transcript_50599:269-1132(+)
MGAGLPVCQGLREAAPRRQPNAPALGSGGLGAPVCRQCAEARRKMTNASDDDQVVHALREFAEASRFRRAVMSLMAWSLSAEETSRVRESFLAIDESRQGTITMGELKKALSGCFEITDEQVKPIFEALDTAANEEIHYSEFLAAMVSKRIAINEDLLRATFQHFDVDKTGYITVENLKDVLGESFDGVRVEELIKEADFTHDGRVSLEEFIRYLKIDGLDGAAGEVIDRVRSKEGVEARQCRRLSMVSVIRDMSPRSPSSLMARLGNKALLGCEFTGCTADVWRRL